MIAYTPDIPHTLSDYTVGRLIVVREKKSKYHLHTHSHLWVTTNKNKKKVRKRKRNPCRKFLFVCPMLGLWIPEEKVFPFTSHTLSE